MLVRVEETLPDGVLEKMHVNKNRKSNSYKIITPNKLEEHDAFLFGIPTRFGNMPTQFKVS
jgi:NAD(P)H dehydrogenase (quinone)